MGAFDMYRSCMKQQLLDYLNLLGRLPKITLHELARETFNVRS